MQRRRGPGFSRSPSTEPVVSPVPRVCRPGGVLVLLITDVVSTAANYNAAREILSRNVAWDSLLPMEQLQPTRKSEATRQYSLKRLNARL
jgi:hypothetical protein